MNYSLKLRTIWILLTIIVLLLGGTLAATGSPPLAATSTPKPVQESSYSKGFIPPPMDLSHLTGQRMPEGIRTQALPSSWDWRDAGKVTSVKDQGYCGSCYTFASIGDFESELLIDGAGTYDFSENNAKECNWRELNDFQYPDPGDYWGSCDGGNYYMMANLFSKKGTVLESDDPYMDSDVSCNSSVTYQKTLLDWRIISGNAVPDPEVLKQYIYDHGPVYTTMYSSFPDFGNYTASSDPLYYTGSENPDHAVLIVGWDDNLAHAGGTGAWIVKNSWGTGWGKSGFFEIAYGSAKIGWYSSFMYDWQDYDSDGGILYYDEDGFSGWWGYSDTTAWGLAVFTPTVSTNATRVEFWTTDATTDVDVYVYDDFDGNNPTNLLWQNLDLSFSEAGYHSVPLTSILPLAAGDDVVVAVKFTNDSFGSPIPLDYNGPKTGGTYTSHYGSSGTWSESSLDIGIRLRTSSVPAPNVGITKEVIGSDFEPGAPITFTLTVANSGSKVASQVIVTDVVPSEVMTATYDSTLAITPTGTFSYAWTVEPMGVGASGVITLYGWISSSLASGFSFENTATISDPEDDTPNNNTSSVKVGGSTIYLPLITRCWPQVPYLSPINNSNGDGVYTVEWSWVACGSSSPSYYQLQADTDPQFGSPDSFTRYDTSFDAYSPAPATYYWRVRAYLSGQGYSDWSNVQSTTVTSWRAYVWVDNDTGGSLTVEIVGVARKSFSTGFHYWRSISPGRYTYKAWAWCGSGSWTEDFVAGENVLSFWCGYSTASGAEDILSTHKVHESQAIRDVNTTR